MSSYVVLHQIMLSLLMLEVAFLEVKGKQKHVHITAVNLEIMLIEDADDSN